MTTVIPIRGRVWRHTHTDTYRGHTRQIHVWRWGIARGEISLGYEADNWADAYSHCVQAVHAGRVDVEPPF